MNDPSSLRSDATSPSSLRSDATSPSSLSSEAASPSSSRSGAGSPGFGGMSREETHSALFAQMVVQQSNLAMLLLGKVPHPAGGKGVRDLEAARLLIDQLEAIEAKTRGNLNSSEMELLKQSLMALHLAFVEVAAAAPPEPATPAPATETGHPGPEPKTAPAENTGAAGEDESRKRFSKKY